MNSSNELDILGSSPEISRVRKAVKAIAKISENVFILGEVGSGREFIAKTIHRLSGGKDHAFKAVQCSAIGDTLEMEDIFGGKNGSAAPHKIKFAGSKGTLYLDGIEHLLPEYQDKLFNILSAKITDNFEKHEALIIASAEPAIEEQARKRTFRFDLYQLLNRFKIEVPAIRDRRQDVITIFTHFLEKFCSEYNKPMPTIPYDIFEETLEYDWPGNVEEIRNCVRNMVVLSPEGELSPEFLPFHVQRNPLESLAARDLPSAVGEVERFLIRRALVRFGGNQTKAAKVLQVSEAALRYKMKKYGFSSK